MPELTVIYWRGIPAQVKATGDITIDSSGKLSVKSSGATSIQASGPMAVKGAKVAIN